MNKRFILNPEKELAQICAVVFEKNRLASTHWNYQKNDVIEPKARLT